MDIRDKVIVVTGASGGIGLATARALAQAGANVVLSARSQQKLEQVAQELTREGHSAVAIPADMRNRSAVYDLIETTFRQFGRIDVLMNNAGQSIHGTIADLDLDAFRKVIDLNIFGVIYAMQAVIPKMRSTGGGLIVNISSIASKMSIPGLAGYAATKSALNTISQTARNELAGDNIRVLTIFPRGTATRLGENALGVREIPRGVNTHRIPDTPERVAQRILEAIQSEVAEQYMEDPE